MSSFPTGKSRDESAAATTPLCAVCGDEIEGETTRPVPDRATHPECEERFWDPPGEAYLTEESW